MELNKTVKMMKARVITAVERCISNTPPYRIENKIMLFVLRYWSLCLRMLVRKIYNNAPTTPKTRVAPL
jgi:hypothetical protein